MEVNEELTQTQILKPDNSPLSRRLACYSLSQRFRLPHKYRQYSLGRRNHCDNELLRDPLAQW